MKYHTVRLLWANVDEIKKITTIQLVILGVNREIQIQSVLDHQKIYLNRQFKKPKEQQKQSRGPEGNLHGTLSLDVQKSRSADVTGRGSLFSLHLSVVEYKFIIQPGTGRSPLPLLSSICRLALGFFSCMVDILINTSFLDDMGDHSKSKIFLFLLLYCHFVAILWAFKFTFISYPACSLEFHD